MIFKQNFKHKIKRLYCVKYMHTWQLKETKKQKTAKTSNRYARIDHN